MIILTRGSTRSNLLLGALPSPNHKGGEALGLNYGKGLQREEKNEIFLNDCPEYNESLFLSGTVLGANWTLMVYMDGDNNLESYGIEDFMELSALGSDANTNVLVQFDRTPGYTNTFGDWTNCQRFYITAGMTLVLKNAIRDWGDGQGGREVNMADPQTLEDFNG